MEQDIGKKQKKNNKKKGRKRTQGLSKIQKLKNLNGILMALKEDKPYSEIEYVQGQKISCSKKKQKTKTTNSNIKLAQKVEKMTEFWKTIDQHYFPTEQNQLITKLNNFVMEKDNEQFNDIKCQGLNRYNKVLNQKYFDFTSSKEINQLYKDNFVHQLSITQKTYLKALLLIQQKKFFCQSCLKKFQISFEAKFQFQMSRQFKSENHIKKYLFKEQKQLQKINKNYDFEYCDQCTIVPNVVQRVNPIDNLIQILEQKKSQILQFKNLIFERIQSTSSLVNYNAALEIELIKKFLFLHLIEIEKKLLADNIELIVGKKKNMVYVKFIHFDGYYPIQFDELEKLNLYREQSLFKIHRVSYKTIKPHYTYNTALQHITKTIKPLNRQTLQQETKTIINLKNYTSKNNTYICHHCKFIGHKEYFYDCNYKVDKHQDKMSTTERQIFKRFFNLQNEFKNVCDKKFCLYCIKNCYHYQLKPERNSRMCPFCSGICYCLSCEYRDHYMRLFSLYKVYNGDVQALKQQSPIEKVIQYYISIIKSQIDMNMKGKIDVNRKGGRRRIILKIKNQEKNEDKIQKRRDLINQLQMTQLLKKREKIKFEIIENF